MKPLNRSGCFPPSTWSLSTLFIVLWFAGKPGMLSPNKNRWLLRPPLRVEYFDEHACSSACLSVGEHTPGTTRPIFTKLFVQCACYLSSRLCISSSGGAAIRSVLPVLLMVSHFSHNGLWRRRRHAPTPLQRLKRANAHAAWYLFVSCPARQRAPTPDKSYKWCPGRSLHGNARHCLDSLNGQTGWSESLA